MSADKFDEELAAAETSPVEVERVDVAEVVAEARRVLNLGTFDPVATANALGMDDLTLRFALNLMKDMSQTAALKEAGHHQTKRNSLASAASKKANSRAVKKFLELGEQHKAGLPDDKLDEDAQLSILAKAARSANGLLKVSAIKAYRQVQAEIEARKAGPYGLDMAAHDPVHTLHLIASASRLGTVIANELAKANNLDFHADVPAMPEHVAAWLQAAVLTNGHSANGSAVNGHARN